MTDLVASLLALSSLAVIWIAWAKWLGPRAKKRWDKLVGFFQTIAGRDPIIDKITGKEVSPAVPPLGEQMALVSTTLAEVVEVVKSNQHAHQRLDHHETRFERIEEKVAQLDQMTGERVASKLETAALLNAVANRAIDGDIE